MPKLDDLVAHHLEERLLDPERREGTLEALLDRRHERLQRRQQHATGLRKKAAEASARLKRIYDAIESGVVELDDPDLRERVAELKALRDQAKVDAERATLALDGLGNQITPAQIGRMASAARERIRLPGGGYRRDHLRALAQRVEVAEGEVRIMGSRTNLLRTLVAAGDGEGDTAGVPSFVSK
jgi:site-specific DNA recombinase